MYINKRFKFWKWVLYIEIDTYINISKYRIPPLFIGPPVPWHIQQERTLEHLKNMRVQLIENLETPSIVLKTLKDTGLIEDDRHTDKGTT